MWHILMAIVTQFTVIGEAVDMALGIPFLAAAIYHLATVMIIFSRTVKMNIKTKYKNVESFVAFISKRTCNSRHAKIVAGKSRREDLVME